MSHYAIKAIHRLQHKYRTKPQHSPHKWSIPYYSTRVQFAENDDNSPPLDKKSNTENSTICWNFFYYARAIDNTILPSLNEISQHQAQPIKKTNQATDMLLDYLASHSNAKV